MITHEKLLPCPFCGGDVQFRKALWPSDGNTDAIIHAAPSECGLSHFDIGTTDESVIAAWNRRTPPAAVPDVSKAVKQRAWEIADQLWLDTNEKSKLARLICDAFSAAPTPPVDDGWRPIETAPKDGTLIDVWTTCGERVPDVKWERGAWREWTLGGFDTMGWHEITGSPTHWRPLPASPKVKEE